MSLTSAKHAGSSSISAYSVHSDNGLSFKYDVPVQFKFYKNEIQSQDANPIVILPKNRRYVVRCNIAEDDMMKECYAILVAEENLPVKGLTIASSSEDDALLGIEVLSFGGRKKGDMSRLPPGYDVTRLTNYSENFKWAFLLYESEVSPYVTYKNPFFTFSLTLSLHFRHEKSYIANCYEELLNKQIGCDVYFDFKNDETFGAHIPFLIARSPVFAAMFEHDMLESRSKRIKVTEENPETFKVFLKYLYSGTFTKLPSIEEALELYATANIYQTEDLKHFIMNSLRASVSKKTAIQLLVFADQFSIHPLKEACLKIIAQYGQEICSSVEWENLARKYPELGILVTRRILGINVARPTTAPSPSEVAIVPKRARTI